jgi:hypothetical protein
MSMKDPAKYDAYVSEEGISPYDGMQVTEHGDFLCVQWSEHPPHIYRRIRPGDKVHRFTDRMEHDGKVYQLEYIEDEKEHATAY